MTRMPPATPPSPPAEVAQALAAGQSRFLSRRNDRLTVELVETFRRSGLHPIVLKGASTRAWLGLRDRTSADIDLWVHPRDRHRAERVLGALGYTRIPGVHADNWTSREGPPIDLHRTLPRLTVDGSTAWDRLQTHRTPLELTSGTIDILDRAAHLVHVAIHATQDDLQRSRSDLVRAVSLADPETLRNAAEISRDLGVNSSVAWALQRDHLSQAARHFGPPRLLVNAPQEAGWWAFLRSPVSPHERSRRALRVGQLWVRWNLGRTWRVLTLRSRRIQRLRSVLSNTRRRR